MWLMEVLGEGGIMIIIRSLCIFFQKSGGYNLPFFFSTLNVHSFVLFLPHICHFFIPLFVYSSCFHFSIHSFFPSYLPSFSSFILLLSLSFLLLPSFIYSFIHSFSHSYFHFFLFLLHFFSVHLFIHSFIHLSIY